MEKYRKVLNKIIDIASYCGGVIAFIMMLLTTADVIYRNIFGGGFVGVYEFTQHFAMPLIVFLGIPQAYKMELLPRVGDLIDHAPEKIRKAMAIVVYVTDIFLYGLLTYVSILSCRRVFSDKTAVAVGKQMWSTYPTYIFIVLGFAFVVLFVLLNFKVRKSVDMEDYKEEWE